jgi:hypothetical protein
VKPRRFWLVLCLYVLIAAPSDSTAVRNLRIDDLVKAADVIAIVEISDVKLIGAAQPILYHDQMLQSQAYEANLRVKRFLKGTAREGISVSYALPTSFVGYRGLQRGIRIVFLRRERGNYSPVDPYYPDFPALISIPASERSQPTDGDFAAAVIREMVAVIASPSSSFAEKSQILQVEYALPVRDDVVAAFREGLSYAAEPELRQRLQGELIRFGDITELPSVVHLLLTDTAASDQRMWLLYVVANRVSDRRAIPAIQPLLRSGDTSLRKAAVEALWHIADPTAIPELLKSLDDPDQDVRFYAVRALSEIANEPGWGGPGESQFQEHQQEYLTHWRNWVKDRAK